LSRLTAIWALAAGVALALHGAIHLMGFVVDWRLASMQTLPYRTTVLSRQLDIGTAGLHSVGLFSLLAALGFITVGVRLVWHGRLRRAPIRSSCASSPGLTARSGQ
jgi:hypothetical protein